MDWVAFHQAGGPMAFVYPRDWTIRGDRHLELVSPAGSVVRWVAFRSPDDCGDEVVRYEVGPESWQLGRRRVLVRVDYAPTPAAQPSEKDVVLAIVGSTRPDPEPPEAMTAFVQEVVDHATRAFPAARVAAEGTALRVDGRTVFDLAQAFRDVTLHPSSRTARVEQILAVLQLEDQPTPGWTEAQSAVFPLLVPAAHAAERVVLPLNQSLCVAYALDQGPVMRRVTRPHLADWDVAPDVLHARALHNLDTRTLFRGRTRSDTHGSLTVVGGHTFATAEVLLPRFREALVATLGSEFWVAMPARDVVGAARTGDEAELRVFAEGTYAADPYPVTPRLFMSRADGLTEE